MTYGFSTILVPPSDVKVGLDSPHKNYSYKLYLP